MTGMGEGMSKIRQARIQDARDIGRIEVDTWRETYAGMLPDKVLLGMSVDRQAAFWTNELWLGANDVRVVEDRRHGVVAFGQCGPQRNPKLGFGGEVYTLYVHPEAQGSGIGRQLLMALFSRLVEQGHDSALVWVVRANPARFFYEHVGGKLSLHRPIPVGGRAVPALGYGWRDLPDVVDRFARQDPRLASGQRGVRR
jgi:GNAT superfamily N-acetyltransferase